MNITAKILPALYFPNIILFKIFNRINLNFGGTIVALNLKLLRKIKSGCQLAANNSETKKNVLIFFGLMAIAQRIIKYLGIQASTELKSGLQWAQPKDDHKG